MLYARLLLILVATTSAVSCVYMPRENKEAQHASKKLVFPSLRRFASEEEFNRYRKTLEDLSDEYGAIWHRPENSGSIDQLLAKKAKNKQTCTPPATDCSDDLEEIAVTGMKAAAPKTSITNNQDSDVDEGDIVKLAGKFLIALQDGRLFSVDSSRALRLVDRINLYQDGDEAWYDELLVFGKQLVVTGFSYRDSSTIITVLSVDELGTFTLEGRYQLESNDYYSAHNYASRLVHGQLLIYTPLYMPSSINEPLRIPRIRRWTPQSGYTEWQPLFRVTDIYTPIQPTFDPQIHTISICPLTTVGTLECNSRAVIGPYRHEMYVSGSNAYLWIVSDNSDWAYDQAHWDECPDVASSLHLPQVGAVAYQFPLNKAQVLAALGEGAPADQFAFEESHGHLHALTRRIPIGCYSYKEAAMQFASIPLNRFASSTGYFYAPESIRVPNVNERFIEERYTATHLLYGTPQGSYQAYWYGDEPYKHGELIAVPLNAPENATTLSFSHSMERVETFGSNAVVFGYQANYKMAVSTVDLQRWPRVADTKEFGDVVESEGRSHAFNYISSDDNSGTFGLPTIVSRRTEKNSSYDRQEPSDIQFFTANRWLRITPLGFLGGIPENNDGYHCEVSCVDWYGNARPLFLDGRIFALTGTELIEGALQNNVIVETGRLRLTSMPEHRRE